MDAYQAGQWQREVTGKSSPVGPLGMVWGGGRGIKLETPASEGAKATALTECVCPPPSQPPSATPHTSSPAWHLWTPSLTTSVPSQKSHYNAAVTILPAPSPAGHPSGPLKGQEAVRTVGQDELMRALRPPGLLLLAPSQQPASGAGSVQAVMQEGREAMDLTSPSLCRPLWLRAAQLSSQNSPCCVSSRPRGGESLWPQETQSGSPGYPWNTRSEPQYSQHGSRRGTSSLGSSAHLSGCRSSDPSQT